jgi:hypothetical protein
MIRQPLDGVAGIRRPLKQSPRNEQRAGGRLEHQVEVRPINSFVAENDVAQ